MITIRHGIKALNCPFIRILVIIFPMFLCHCSAIYHGPVSDHFDGKRFFGPEPDNTFSDHLKWFWEMKTVDWPKWIDDPPQQKPVAAVQGGDLRVVFVNHATVLIQTDGLNILTDPIWSKRAGPFSWAGSERIRSPGIAMDDLPKIDIVLISHDHYDHLDLRTLKDLDTRFHPQILCGLGVGALLTSEGFADVHELDWWQERIVKQEAMKITFVPASHNSKRGIFDSNMTLWGGFVIEGSAGRIYFAGDTGYGSFIDSLHSKFADFRLTILPIGNYEKRWFMKNQHMNPDDAVRAHRVLCSKQSVGIHFATFNEHAEQAVDAHEKDLKEALQKNGLAESDFWILKFGEGRTVPK